MVAMLVVALNFIWSVSRNLNFLFISMICLIPIYYFMCLFQNMLVYVLLPLCWSYYDNLTDGVDFLFFRVLLCEIYDIRGSWQCYQSSKRSLYFSWGKFISVWRTSAKPHYSVSLIFVLIYKYDASRNRLPSKWDLLMEKGNTLVSACSLTYSRSIVRTSRKNLERIRHLLNRQLARPYFVHMVNYSFGWELLGYKVTFICVMELKFCTFYVFRSKNFNVMWHLLFCFINDANPSFKGKFCLLAFCFAICA